MRLGVAVAVACLSMTGLAVADQAQAAIRKPINIEAQGLAPALQLLAKERDVQLVYRSELVGDRQTGGAAGEFTVEEALTKLLSGTGLTFEYLDDKGITVVPIAVRGPQGSSSSTDPESRKPERSKRTFWDRFRLAQAEIDSSVSNSPESATSTSADSDERNVNLEEVVVTAQKKEERQQDVPVPMTVFSSEALVKSGQVRLRDYYSKVPGLSLTTDSQGEVQVSLRGIGTGVYTNPAIGIALDDMPVGATIYSAFSGTGAVMPEVDPSDLSSVEILRGPQGTLYGSSSIGGLFKFVTAKPSTDEFSGRVETGVSGVAHGDDLGWVVRGAANMPISDNMALRASAYGRRDTGYIDNVLTGDQDANSADARGGRLSMLYEPTEAVSLLLAALVQDYDRNADSLEDTSLNRYQVVGPKGSGSSTRRFSHYSARLNIDLGGMELTSLTAYQTNDMHSTSNVSALGNIFAGPGGLEVLYGPGNSGMYYFADSKLERFTQEIRLASDGDKSIEWLLGAFYSDEKSPGAGGWRVVNPLTNAIAGAAYDAEASSVLSEIAGFANFDVHFSETFDVQLGGRVGKYSLDVKDYSYVFSLFGGPPVLVPDQSIDETASTFLVTPRYKLSENQMIYARVASGYRPGGIGGFGAPPFKSDTSINYELGLKGSYFNRLLTVDASVFRIDWKDVQVDVDLPGLPIGSSPANAAEARSDGVELTAEVRPLTGLSIRGSLVYNDAKITATSRPPAVVQAQVGDALPYVSPYSGSLSIEQEIPVHIYRELTAFIGADAAFVDDRAGNIRANSTDPVETLPGYTTVDVRAGLRSEVWSLNAYVNNIGDRRGMLSLNPVVGIQSVQFVQPRSFGLVASYEF